MLDLRSLANAKDQCPEHISPSLSPSVVSFARGDKLLAESFPESTLRHLLSRTSHSPGTFGEKKHNFVVWPLMVWLSRRAWI